MNDATTNREQLLQLNQLRLTCKASSLETSTLSITSLQMERGYPHILCHRMCQCLHLVLTPNRVVHLDAADFLLYYSFV